ncbi:hypothetical protein MHH81_04290 [Psychrobacillus sp. FSL H8-0484]|uniref:hypothetical protein n=1 Tax=Psychrobacillus sp. FSL H8-0484 TaxID=2921390 RepID=UPI0030F8D642
MILQRCMMERYGIFLGGYRAAEKEAQQREVHFLETSGSVVTKAISLLEYIGFRKNIGQDLVFA